MLVDEKLTMYTIGENFLNNFRCAFHWFSEHLVIYGLEFSISETFFFYLNFFNPPPPTTKLPNFFYSYKKSFLIGNSRQVHETDFIKNDNDLILGTRMWEVWGGGVWKIDKVTFWFFFKCFSEIIGNWNNHFSTCGIFGEIKTGMWWR